MAQSTLEKRRNKKALQKLNKIEESTGRARSVVAVQGLQKFNWSDTATIVVAVFAGIFLIGLLLGYIVGPGGILLALGFNAVKPRRTISISAHGVTIWEQSAWTGSVKNEIATYPRSAIRIDTWTTVAAHPPVKLKQEEVFALANAQQELGPVAPPTPAGFVPPPPAMANPPLV